MGRLWQTVILRKEFPVFEFLPFETLISQKQREYYEVLASCDKKGESTESIEYMNVFKNISPATASRDLRRGVELSYFQKFGDKNKTIYKI